MRNVKLALTISGLRKFFVLAAVLALMCLGGVTQAALVDYTVSGWGPTSYPAPTTPPANAPWGTDGYPVDTLELQTYTGSLDLTPGTYTQKINTLLWSIDYTYGGTATDPNVWSDLSFNVNALRNISLPRDLLVLSVRQVFLKLPGITTILLFTTVRRFRFWSRDSK